ncbi:hypothetical protein RGQ15_20610 [Paracoccus sp. MBLB3053]|uniref:Uncharacterized protein n=1 Tax=Paracoccus aurantius TaxID=3073814 RepID=A0ABU2HZH9_9RHOB|nr:hypothetical protein [Paracoccus sp. MBLB3053]MDS9469955.1 hypothetical protein [Paracoccus sp. MBLB3053]
MTEIPNDLLVALRAALVDLNISGAAPGVDDARENAAEAAQRAIDDLLATSYQIVEVASLSSSIWDIGPAARHAGRGNAVEKISTPDLALI